MLRDWWRAPSGGKEESSFDEEELTEAVGIVVDYRGGFKKVTVGLRQFVDRESSEITVGQRLKRNPQILNKLARFDSMRLTQMEDIAGCRAILPGGAEEIAGVLRRIRRNWDVIRIEDYAASPKFTGYRAPHVVVRRDGHPVEIQLRTPFNTNGRRLWSGSRRGLASPSRTGRGAVGASDLSRFSCLGDVGRRARGEARCRLHGRSCPVQSPY
jgi:RelA/SpoT family protein